MKTTSPILLYPFVALFLCGSLFKILYWPGANALMLLSAFLLLLLELYFFAGRMREQRRPLGKAAYLLLLINGPLLTLAAMAKILHWPMANVLLMSAIVLFIFPTTIVNVLFRLKEKSLM